MVTGAPAATSWAFILWNDGDHYLLRRCRAHARMENELLFSLDNTHQPKQHSSFYLILLRYLTAMSSRQPYWKIRYWQGKRFSVVRKLCVAIQETRKEDDRFRRRLAAFYFVLTLRFKEKILRYCHKEWHIVSVTQTFGWSWSRIDLRLGWFSKAPAAVVLWTMRTPAATRLARRFQ